MTIFKNICSQDSKFQSRNNNNTRDKWISMILTMVIDSIGKCLMKKLFSQIINSNRKGFKALYHQYLSLPRISNSSKAPTQSRLTAEQIQISTLPTL